MRPGVGTFLVATAVALAPGCGAPERSPLFGVDWPEATREAVDAGARDAAAALPVPGVAADPAAVRAALPAPLGDATTPLRLTLGRTLLLTLAANRQLSVAAASPTISAALARFERGLFDPEAFAELRYQERSTTETSRATGTRFTVDGNDLNAVAGLRQLLPTGTDVEVNASSQRSSSDRAPEQQDARVGVSVTQQLLRGFGSEVNLVRLKQAELDVVASEHELAGFTQRLMSDAERAWWLYRLAEQRLGLFERAVQLAERQNEAARRRIAAGAISPSEGAAAEAESALRRQDLIDARSLAETRRLELLRFLGGPAGALEPPLAAEAAGTRVFAGSFGDATWLSRPVETVATDEETLENEEAPEPVTDLDERVELAAKLRPELAEARVRLDQDRLETVFTRNGLLPRLEVFLDLGKAGFDDTFGGSFDDLEASEAYDLAAGFRFVAPIGNDAAEGRDLAATATRAQSAAAVANLRQLVGLEVRRAAIELERARQQITASRATRDFQRAVARGEQARFEAGEATSLDAALASRDLLAAEVDVLTSRTEHRLALIALHLAEGSLLARRGIEVEAFRDAEAASRK